jgi:hypothetical protein
VSANSYVEEIRDARHRPSVLKMRVLSLRSGDAKSPIIIFEGKSDVGPYEVWIKRIDETFYYKPLPGTGKAQLLSFRESIELSQTEGMNAIYFVIDKDFDGLRGKLESRNLFCLDGYSFENYLTTPEALESVLNDEFECADSAHNIPITLSLYNSTCEKFCLAMLEVNFRLYLATIFKLPRKSIENRSHKFVNITLSDVVKSYESGDLRTLIPLEQEPRNDQVEAAKENFDTMGNKMKTHRGKYIFSFFLSWLDQLASARKSGAHPFQESKAIKYNRAMMTERSLSSRVATPEGLSEFIDLIKLDSSEKLL